MSDRVITEKQKKQSLDRRLNCDETWHHYWYSADSSQTAVTYNANGRALQPSLTPGVTYQWSVFVQDANGNRTSQQVNYTP
jgi:hypothetical protein